MANFQFLDFIFLPVSFLTELRIVVWPVMLLSAIWLFYRHFSKVRAGEKFSIVLWHILLGIAAVSATCVVLLAILSPEGPNFYRVAIGAVAAVPLVVPAIACFFVRPRDSKQRW